MMNTVDNFLLNNPKKRFLEKTLGPFFNFLVEHHISPVVVGLLVLIIMCVKLLPLLKEKDGRYNDFGVLLIAVTVLTFIVFLYTQIKLLI